MSRALAGQRRSVRVTTATLLHLGPNRLAELLGAAAKADTALRRSLALEVASGAQNLGEEVDRQLDRIRSAKGKLNATRASKLARELERVLDVISDRLRALDAAAAARRLFDVLALGAAVLPRRTGEGTALVEVFASAGSRLAKVLTTASVAEQLQLIEALHAALVAKEVGGTEELAALVSPALAAESRRALWALVEADLTAAQDGLGRGATAQQVVRLTALLGHLADADGDVDAFLAAQARREAPLRDHVGSARRLLDAERSTEAIALLDAAPAGAITSGPIFAELRIRVLDALGRRDDAQAERWRLFRAHLSIDALRQHLKRLPGFDDVEREDEALAHVAGYTDATDALAFLMAWPDHRRAAALVRSRHGRLDSDRMDVLEHAANTLTPKDPLAATLLLRALIDAALDDGRRTSLKRASLLLAECSTLAAAVADWEGRPDHAAYASRLRFMVRRPARSGRRR